MHRRTPSHRGSTKAICAWEEEKGIIDSSAHFRGRGLRVPLPAPSRLAALLLLALGCVSVGLGALRGLSQLQLSFRLELSRSRLLAVGSLIGRRPRAERSVNARTEEILNQLWRAEIQKLKITRQVGNVATSPAVWAPEPALWLSLRLFALCHAVLWLSSLSSLSLTEQTKTSQTQNSSRQFWHNPKIPALFRTVSLFNSKPIV